MVAVVGVTSRRVTRGGAGVTVNVAGLLVTLLVPSDAWAVISAVPTLRPWTVAVAMPLDGFVVTDSTVATFVLLDVKVIVIPVIGRPYWSKACAVNCVV